VNCEQVRCLAALAATGDVTQPERRALESHVGGCVECQSESEAFEALCDELAAMRVESAPAYVYAAVRAHVIAELSEQRDSGWFGVWPAFAAVLACSLVLAVAIHYQVPLAEQPLAHSAAVAPIFVASMAESISKASPPELRRRIRRAVAPPKLPEPQEPVVVQMFTSDPDVVIYWIADNQRKSSKKETLQ
jgi:anti-sigma factor RsiW